jgi:hypothetical protein
MQDQALPTTTIKPASIGQALGLFWASLGLGFVKLPLDWAYLTSQASPIFNTIIIVCTFGITAFFIWKIGQGKNWARIVFLVLFVLGTVPFIFILRSALARSVVSGLVSILQIGLQTVGFFLIFASPGREWFKARPR